MRSIRQALRQEASLAAKLRDLKQEIYQLVHDAGTMEGVTPIQTSFPCAKINISCLKRNFVLTPSYYLSQEQAKVVEQRLSSAKTVTDFVARIHEMADKGVAEFGRESYRLNDKTCAVLKDYVKGV